VTTGDLERAIATTLDECLAVRAGENVLVVTDPKKRALADAIVGAARDRGAEAVVAEMIERVTHGTEPPDPIAVAMRESDVVIAPTSKSLSHTQARHAATQAGARIATMPDITEDMMARTMSADFGAIAKRSAAVAEALSNGGEVRITTSRGTDVTLGIAGRKGIADDGRLTEPGAFGNLPAGEGFIAPVEGTTTGRIVFDGSIWPSGKLTEPLVVDIEAGFARDLQGPAAAEFRSKLEPHGENAFAVAELGIGTNEKARLSGNVLEDEKILGTIHVAFGDNHSFGGTIRVSSHQDGIVLEPTVLVDGEPLLEAGRLLV
jgi:leucyl aminopeptidase (aminopeptidase T)